LILNPSAVYRLSRQGSWKVGVKPETLKQTRTPTALLPVGDVRHTRTASRATTPSGPSAPPVSTRARIAWPKNPHGPGLGKKRWVVERTIAWLHQYRRLRVRYERRDDIHEAFLAIGCSLICLKLLNAPESF
jgi:transposase